MSALLSGEEAMDAERNYRKQGDILIDLLLLYFFIALFVFVVREYFTGRPATNRALRSFYVVFWPAWLAVMVIIFHEKISGVMSREI